MIIKFLNTRKTLILNKNLRYINFLSWQQLRQSNGLNDLFFSIIRLLKSTYHHPCNHRKTMILQKEQRTKQWQTTKTKHKCQKQRKKKDNPVSRLTSQLKIIKKTTKKWMIVINCLIGISIAFILTKYNFYQNSGW